MKILKIVNEEYGENNYLVVKSNSAILIDASASFTQIEDNLKIFGEDVKLKGVLLTHEHFDHISSLDNIVKEYNVPVYISAQGKENLYDESKNLSIMSKPFRIKQKKQIKTFKDGDELIFDDISVKCFHTPGHSMGSSVFVIDDNMFTGDTVFKVNVGRFDLYGGDQSVENISLIRIMQDLSRDCSHFYPGHGANFDKNELNYNIQNHLGEN